MLTLRVIAVFIGSAVLAGCASHPCPAPDAIDTSTPSHDCFYRLQVNLKDSDSQNGIYTAKIPRIKDIAPNVKDTYRITVGEGTRQLVQQQIEKDPTLTYAYVKKSDSMEIEPYTPSRGDHFLQPK
jgi:hypothetical protein